MGANAINLEEKFPKFFDYWSPKVIAELNDYQIKLVKFQGDFIWHAHPDTDEVFLVTKGTMEIEFRDFAVVVQAGEMYVIPKGTEHCTRAERECQAMLIEPRGVVNTGKTERERAAENDVWI
ncbi:MAG: cupin domain-containing protein [Cyanobacteria bacterium P01_D01_bin.105]